MKKIFLIALIVLCSGIAKAQSSSGSSGRGFMSDLFGMPTRSSAGLQMGILSFYGDVRPNVGHSWISGKPGVKLDYMLELGREGMFAGKLSFMYGMFKEGQTYNWGNVTVPVADLASYPNYDETILNPFNPQYEQLSSYEEGNLNFRSHLFVIGLQGEYRVRNIPGFRNIYPYVSTGFNLVLFNPYADRSYDKNGQIFYETERLNSSLLHPYPDPDNPGNTLLAPGPAHSTPRDQKYETQLKSASLYGQGNFSGVTLGIPLEIGFDFKVMNIINLRLGTSFTFTLTDNIDGVSGKVARSSTFDSTLPYGAPVNRASRLQVNNYYDFYAYTYVACYFYLPFL